jgi:cobalamin synthase
MVLRALFRKKVGGVTGDLLGAASELTEALLLLCVAVGGGRDAFFLDWGVSTW